MIITNAPWGEDADEHAMVKGELVDKIHQLRLTTGGAVGDYNWGECLRQVSRMISQGQDPSGLEVIAYDVIQDVEGTKHRIAVSVTNVSDIYKQS